MNYPVSRSDIYVAKGVTNEIWFYLKDIDLKAVSLTDSIVLRVTDRDAGIVLLTVTMTLDDAPKARYIATLAPTAIDEIDPGFYRYAVTRVATNGTERLLYADRSRTEFGVIEVRDGPIPPETAAVTIGANAFVTRDTLLYSGAYAGPLQVGSQDGLMTAAIYGNGFTGNVAVQGTLDLSPSNVDQDWFDMAAANVTNLTGSYPMTVDGNASFVRFKIRDLSNLSLSLGGNSSTTGNSVTFPTGTPTGFVKITFRA